MELAIREIRSRQGMSITELARRLDTSAANVSRWERDPQRINLVTLTRIAEVLGVPPQALITPSSSIEYARRTPTIVTVRNLMEGAADLPFDNRYLATITGTKASELAALIVEDDAMSATLNPGDIVLIEPCERVKKPGLYVSASEASSPRIRRVMPGLTDNSISILTDNEDYPNFDDRPESAFPVTGRVVWIGSRA